MPSLYAIMFSLLTLIIKVVLPLATLSDVDVTTIDFGPSTLATVGTFGTLTAFGKDLGLSTWVSI